MLEEITATIVNYRTLDLTRRCFEGLLGCYPDLQIVLVDNASQDQSTIYIEDLARGLPNVSAIFNRPNPEAPMPPSPPEAEKERLAREYPGDVWVHEIWKYGNIGHTPALHQVYCLCKTPYLFTLDSDCIILRCGFLEKMLEEFHDDSSVYGVGYLYAGPDGPAKSHTPQVHGSAALWDVAKYKSLHPYRHHCGIGVPHYAEAQAKGYKVVDFPVGGRFRRCDRSGNVTEPHNDYISHLCKGSRKIVKHPSPRFMYTKPIRPQLMNLFLWGPKVEFLGVYFEDQEKKSAN